MYCTTRRLCTCEVVRVVHSCPLSLIYSNISNMGSAVNAVNFIIQVEVKTLPQHKSIANNYSWYKLHGKQRGKVPSPYAKPRRR